MDLRLLLLVRKQNLHSETDFLGHEEAVGVVESQHVCGGQRTWSRRRSLGRSPVGESLTDSRTLAGQRSVLRNQVSVVSLIGNDFLHLARLLPLPLFSLQEDPKADVGAVAGEVPPERRKQVSRAEAV